MIFVFCGLWFNNLFNWYAKEERSRRRRRGKKKVRSHNISTGVLNKLINLFFRAFSLSLSLTFSHSFSLSPFRNFTVGVCLHLKKWIKSRRTAIPCNELALRRRLCNFWPKFYISHSQILSQAIYTCEWYVCSDRMCALWFIDRMHIACRCAKCQLIRARYRLMLWIEQCMLGESLATHSGQTKVVKCLRL